MKKSFLNDIIVSTQTTKIKYPSERKEDFIMKPIIFARIADMKYYRGITDNDKPYNGGAYVHETGNAHECYNFDAVNVNGEDICLGFVMLIGNSANANIQVRLESIIGGKNLRKEEVIDGVTVVWCAKSERGNSTRVVGFYKNATVYRYGQYVDFLDGNDEVCYTQQFNFTAKKENCVLLPYSERYTKSEWYIPTSGKNGYDFGFGRSNVWYANGKEYNPKETEFVERMLNSIENYSGENWMDEEEV